MEPDDPRRNFERRIRAHAHVLAAIAAGICLTVQPSPATAGRAELLRDFKASPANGAVVLSWTLVPAQSAHVVIRYREDGPAPSSPADGTFLYDADEMPDGKYRLRHDGVSAEHRYAYTAFVIDEAGVVLASREAIGTPLDAQPPGIVQNLRRDDTRGPR